MKEDFNRSLVRYVTGFGLCLILSVFSYGLTVKGWDIDASVIAALLLVMAAIQVYVQLLFFLHIGDEKKSVYSRRSTFLLTIGMAFVIVIGSIWIMKNLDYRMGMSPDAMKEYMQTQNKKGF